MTREQTPKGSKTSFGPSMDASLFFCRLGIGPLHCTFSTGCSLNTEIDLYTSFLIQSFSWICFDGVFQQNIWRLCYKVVKHVKFKIIFVQKWKHINHQNIISEENQHLCKVQYLNKRLWLCMLDRPQIGYFWSWRNRLKSETFIKNQAIVFCIIFLEIRSLEGWTLSHLKSCPLYVQIEYWIEPLLRTFGMLIHLKTDDKAYPIIDFQCFTTFSYF